MSIIMPDGPFVTQTVLLPIASAQPEPSSGPGVQRLCQRLYANAHTALHYACANASASAWMCNSPC
jgi:hypothetical protein